MLCFDTNGCCEIYISIYICAGLVEKETHTHRNDCMVKDGMRTTHIGGMEGCGRKQDLYMYIGGFRSSGGAFEERLDLA